MSTISSQLPATSQSSTTQVKAQHSETEQTFLGFRRVLAEQYMAWTELPEAERIRHTYLEKHGLTETGLDTLSPVDRAVHEEKIAELTKQPVFANTSATGSSAGDTLSRPVLTLQSVLEVFDPHQVGSQDTEDPKQV